MINNITVCVNNIEKSSYAALAACRFAKRYAANLNAVYIKLDTVEIVRWAGSAPIDLADQILANEDKREKAARQQFDSLTKDLACKTEWKTVNQSVDPIKQLMCTDLFFADQPVGNELTYFGDESFINNLILQTARPVIMIPNGWQQEEVGTRILLGWKQSPEAMRAATDAIPIMENSAAVNILHIVKSSLFQTDSTASPDIEAYLLSKGIKTNLVVEGVKKHDSEGLALLNWAEDNDIDLIVIGGYGHSRLREVVMGGMTKHLIDHSTIPVLFSH